VLVAVAVEDPLVWLALALKATVGVDVLDFIEAKLILPNLSITVCSGELLICQGHGCEEKRIGQ